jgi:type VI secretion system protein ImpF
MAGEAARVFEAAFRSERGGAVVSTQGRKIRLRTPLMLAFRSAYESRDARQKADLRDESGERVIAGRRAMVRGAVTESIVRREVNRDLETLMNTINLDSSYPLEPCDEVKRSILNYGLPDVTHRSIDEGSVGDVIDEIQEALLNFEPRLVKDTIQVQRDNSADIAQLQVRFVVRADMWSDPLKVPVEFYADVQADTGKVVVSRL